MAYIFRGHFKSIPDLRSLKNKLKYLVFIFFLLIIAGHQSILFAQVFPEVNTPADIQRKQRAENEKLGIYYYSQKDFEKAVSIFKDLYDKQPTKFYYTYYYACLVNLKQFDEAEKLVKQNLRRDKRSLRYEVDLGYIYMMNDKPDKASKMYNDAIQSLQPNRAQIMDLANAFSSRQLYDYAIRTYQRGNELMRDKYAFRNELANLYQISGDYQAMIEEYLNIVESEPNRLNYVEGRLQSILNRDDEGKLSEMLKQALLKRSQKNPDNQALLQMLYWYSIQKKDFGFALIQAKSMDKRFKGDGKIVFDLGRLSLSNDDYKTAEDAFHYLIEKGRDNLFYTESVAGNLKSRFKQLTNNMQFDEKDLRSLQKDYTEALQENGYNSGSVGMIKDLAHLEAFYLHDLDDAIDILQKAIAIPNLEGDDRAECKLELGDILLFKGEVWDASLLYSQVDKAYSNDPIGHEAKFRNARLSYYIGEFGWAKAQLDVLKAATSKLIANDAMELSLLISDNMDPDSTYTGLRYYARADLLAYQNKDNEALKTLDSVSMLGLSHPLDDEVLYKKAEIYIKDKDYKIADSLLALVVSKYPYDILADNALYKRARLQQEVFKDKDSAMKLYEELMLDYPGSLFTTEARKRFRSLRGDLVN
jgi:tetratricopeptide (TPR) repeat protein